MEQSKQEIKKARTTTHPYLLFMLSKKGFSKPIGPGSRITTACRDCEVDKAVGEEGECGDVCECKKINVKYNF